KGRVNRERQGSGTMRHGHWRAGKLRTSRRVESSGRDLNSPGCIADNPALRAAYPRPTSSVLLRRGPARGKGGNTPGYTSSTLVADVMCRRRVLAPAIPKESAMPKHKDLKRLVRSRMKKTGESYTAARAQLIHKKTRTQAATTGSVPPAVDYAG